MLLGSEIELYRQKAGVFYISDTQPILCTAVHMPEISSYLCTGSMTITGVQRTGIREGFNTCIVLKHFLIAFITAAAHDNALMSPESFASGNNAQNCIVA